MLNVLIVGESLTEEEQDNLAELRNLCQKKGISYANVMADDEDAENVEDTENTKDVEYEYEVSSDPKSKVLKNEACFDYIEEYISDQPVILTAFDKFGYILVQVKGHPFSNKDGYIHMHRLMYEKYLLTNDKQSPYLVEVVGYPHKVLHPNVPVIHKDDNITNNAIDNLEIYTVGDSWAVKYQDTNALFYAPYGVYMMPDKASVAEMQMKKATSNDIIWQ